MHKFAIATLLTLLVSACGSSDSDSGQAGVDMPPECVSFYKTMSACNANGQPASAEEAQAQFEAFSQAWHSLGDQAATVEQCRSLGEVLRATPGC